MEADYPPGWDQLRYPWVRAELLACLEELAAPDPRPGWRAEAARGLISGVDQSIHFFFDDHDFDQSDVGVSLFDASEVALVQALKHALDRIIARLPHGGDDEYVNHPLWPTVTVAAVAARDAIGGRP